MAAYMPLSQSPRDCNSHSVRKLDSPSLQIGGGLGPATPIHSPHHSVHSSSSSHSTLHHLTLHEYRKQQYTPLVQLATPPGKSLRRKAAASGLNEVERANSTIRSRTPLSPVQPAQPLQASQSAHQLKANFNSSPIKTEQTIDKPFRSQSAEPRWEFTLGSENLPQKVRNFKSAKRLPKPPAANRARHRHPPPPSAIVTSIHSRPPPFRTPSELSAEKTVSSDTQTTQSSFSLSRFPEPPNFAHLSLSPPRDENEPPPVNTTSFASTAPATPPATPAIIHYRGASFDLVNPHESLLLHDIVTPSRELDSSEYLPLELSEESAQFAEMAPRRALFRDFSSAHATITRRPEESDSNPNLSLDSPQPPTPAAVSPGITTYPSPTDTPGHYAQSPSANVTNSSSDSRFSLAKLTRSLTRRLGKSPETSNEQELQDFGQHSQVSVAKSNVEDKSPQPLDESSLASPKPTYSPTQQESPALPLESDRPESGPSVEISRLSTRRYDSAPLSSMVPDDSSSQHGRGDLRVSLSESEVPSRHYYDDLASIYPSSSIYTGDEGARSNYQPSLASNRQSRFSVPRPGGAEAYALEYTNDTLYRYPDSRRVSQRGSRPFAPDDNYYQSMAPTEGKSDTISKILEDYGEEDGSAAGDVSQQGGMVTTASGAFEDANQIDQPKQAVSASDEYQLGLPFDYEEEYSDVGDALSTHSEDSFVPPIHNVARRPTLVGQQSAPPNIAAPLAPPFEYDDRALPLPESSQMLSADSYGDTRHLLLLERPHTSSSYSQSSENRGVHNLEPSSSYSQPEGSRDRNQSHVSQEALEEAQNIFDDAAAAESESQAGRAIPAMWSRRGSGNLLRSNQLSSSSIAHVQQDSDVGAIGAVGTEDDQDDWETIQLGRPSTDARRSIDDRDSIADYSSSEGTRNSLGLNPDGSLPNTYVSGASHGSSFSRHPSRIPAHANPFTSSPPSVITRASVHSAPQETVKSPPASQAVSSTTTPLFVGGTRTSHPLGKGAVDQPYAYAPWVNPYALTDKETEELLASGPNDEVMYEEERNARGSLSPLRSEQAQPPTSSSFDSSPPIASLQRENTYDKLSVVGPMGNLTGTPHGTGMQATGSSIADNSSPLPGHGLNPYQRYSQHRRTSNQARRLSQRSAQSPAYPGFYATPEQNRSSITRVPPGSTTFSPSQSEHDRSPSEVTLFPGARRSQPSSSSPSPMTGLDHHRKSSASPSLTGSRRNSRAAVTGQTKLRQMTLAPETRSISSQHTNISRVRSIAASDRPSSSNTNTPLRPTHNGLGHASLEANPVFYGHSPHLLVPIRDPAPGDEDRRKKLSWLILACFCLVPPLVILYRCMGDSVMMTVTNGKYRECTNRPKKVAVYVGVAVNLGVSGAILMAVLIPHGAGVL